ncbi:hypothetical protein ACVBEF_08810 [Glaciimonas sp. GG7]
MALDIITFDQISRLCDRDDVIAESLIYPDMRHGFSLKITLGSESYSVVRRDGSPHYFRSIDHVLDALLDVPNISPFLTLDTSGWALSTIALS